MLWRTLLFAAVMVVQPKFVWSEPAIVPPGPGEPRCPNGSRAQIAADLKDMMRDHFKESPVAAGISSQGQLLTLYAADDFSTWTAVVFDPQTKSACLVSYGHDLQILRTEGESL